MKLSPTLQKLVDAAERALGRTPKKRTPKRMPRMSIREERIIREAGERANAFGRTKKRKTTKKRTTKKRKASKKRTSAKRRRVRSTGRGGAGTPRPSNPGIKFGSKRRRSVRAAAPGRAQAAEVEARMALIEAEEAAQESGRGNGALKAAERRYQRALRGETRAADIQRGLGPRGFRRVL